MSQGKAYTEEQKQMIIESLQPFLELGYSRNKACNFIGFDPTTLSVWVRGDEALSMKLTAWENKTTAIAMANIQKAIKAEKDSKDKVKMNSWKWVERKEETMKPKSDITTDGKPIPLLHAVQSNDGNPQSDGDEKED